MISDEPVVLLDLWLTIHTLRVEKQPLQSFCPSKARQGARKAAVTNKLRQNS